MVEMEVVEVEVVEEVEVEVEEKKKKKGQEFGMPFDCDAGRHLFALNRSP